MKNGFFYGSKILAALVLLAILSMAGIGNPKAIPLLTLFFLIVFVVIFFFNKKAQQNQRSTKSGPGMLKITQLIALGVFIAALSLLGWLHGVVGYLVWIVFIGMICAVIYLLIRNRQHHSELLSASPGRQKIGTIILAALAILVPILMTYFGGFLSPTGSKTTSSLIFAILAVLVFLAIVCLAILLINRWGGKPSNRLLGYLLFIIAAVLPGIVVLLVNSDTLSFTGIYVASLIGMILAYFTLDKAYKLS